MSDGKPATLALKATHYPPGQNPPAMAVNCIVQTAVVDGVAYALLLSSCGKLVIQRARVGSAILTKDGKPRVEVTDLLTADLADLVEAAADVFTEEALSQPGDVKCACGMTTSALGLSLSKTCMKCSAALALAH